MTEQQLLVRLVRFTDLGGQPDWNGVLTLSDIRLGKPRRRRRRRFAVAALAAALALALAGVAVSFGESLLWQQERSHNDTPDSPGVIGPYVQIASGDGWALIAWKSAVGLCLDFAVPGNASFSCATPVRGSVVDGQPGSTAEQQTLAGWVSYGGMIGSDGKDTVLGVAASNVANVSVELPDGRLVPTTMVDAPLELGLLVRFFFVRLELPAATTAPDRPSVPDALPEPLELAYIAYDSDGNVISRTH